jgi:predicted enzyme related to lactoylglutathione lyase
MAINRFTLTSACFAALAVAGGANAQQSLPNNTEPVKEKPMKRVTGIGGIFFKAKDPVALRAWYRTHLGIEAEEWGAVFRWQSADKPEAVGSTAWSVFNEKSKHFAPSDKPFMINYRVADLHGLLAALRAEGCAVDDKVDESEYGKFGWVMDPEGNRIELWEPPAGK